MRTLLNIGGQLRSYSCHNACQRCVFLLLFIDKIWSDIFEHYYAYFLFTTDCKLLCPSSPESLRLKSIQIKEHANHHYYYTGRIEQGTWKGTGKCFSHKLYITNTFSSEKHDVPYYSQWRISVVDTEGRCWVNTPPLPLKFGKYMLYSI
jgi:hypothetical protein